MIFYMRTWVLTQAGVKLPGSKKYNKTDEILPNCYDPVMPKYWYEYQQYYKHKTTYSERSKFERKSKLFVVWGPIPW